MFIEVEIAVTSSNLVPIAINLDHIVRIISLEVAPASLSSQAKEGERVTEIYFADGTRLTVETPYCTIRTLLVKGTLP